MPPPPSSPALPLNVSAPLSRPSVSSASSSSTPSTTATPNKPPANPSDISSPHELTAFVEALLEQLDAKFEDMSSQILDRMTQMSTRVDALEASIHDIINGDGAAQGPPSLPQSPSISRDQRRNGST